MNGFRALDGASMRTAVRTMALRKLVDGGNEWFLPVATYGQERYPMENAPGRTGGQEVPGSNPGSPTITTRTCGTRPGYTRSVDSQKYSQSRYWAAQTTGRPRGGTHRYEQLRRYLGQRLCSWPGQAGR